MLVGSAAVTLAVVLGTPAAPRAGFTVWFVAGSLGSDLNPCKGAIQPSSSTCLVYVVPRSLGGS
jgi:hypothetical protein